MGEVGILTVWGAWWGFKVVAASPPAMPQEIPMGGSSSDRSWRPGGVLSIAVAASPPSYATGNPDGRGRCGLYGGPGGELREVVARITSSYATGSPDGGEWE